MRNRTDRTAEDLALALALLRARQLAALREDLAILARTSHVAVSR